MTEASLCKRGFFGKYLRYRIGSQSTNLLICSVLNLLGLPFYALSRLVESSAQSTDSSFHLYASFFGTVCVYALVLLAVTGAAFAFSYWNKKELTDTLGCLPLTHKQRFWGDFLGGYIANVAPFIPAALISVILFSAAFKNYGGTHIGFVAGLLLTLFFVYTFAYIISVLVSAIVGRFVFAEIFSVIGTVIFTLLISSVSRIFLNGITGFSADGEDMFYAIPFGPLFGEVAKVLSLDGAFGEPFDEALLSMNFMIMKPLNIVIFTVAAAGLTVLSYFITKTRKQENVGKIAAHGEAFRVMALLTAATAVMFVVANFSERNIITSYVVGSLIGAGILVVFEVIRRPRSAEAIKTIVGYAGTLALCFGFCALVKATGAFGARYIHVAPEDVEYLSVRTNQSTDSVHLFPTEMLELTEKEDIHRFTENHNSILKTYGDVLESGSKFVLLYKLNDGTTLLRGYHGSIDGLLKMDENLHSLDGYPSALCSFMTDGSKINACSATIEGVFGEINVPSEKLTEFLEILSSEIIEKYSPAAQNCGSANVNISNAEYAGGVYLYVQNDYTRTLEYLNALENNAEDNGDTLTLSLDYYSGMNSSFGVCVYKKDLQNDLVTELFSLLGQDTDGSAEQASKKIKITSTNSISYYVPLSAEKRVIEIMTELAVSSMGST